MCQQGNIDISFILMAVSLLEVEQDASVFKDWRTKKLTPTFSRAWYLYGEERDGLRRVGWLRRWLFFRIFDPAKFYTLWAPIAFLCLWAASVAWLIFN